MKLTLVAWRKARGITQAEMADKIGVRPTTYFRWEKKPQNIAVMYAYRIADVLEVDISDIIFSL